MKIEHKKTARKRRIALIEMRRTSYKDHEKKNGSHKNIKNVQNLFTKYFLEKNNKIDLM